MVYKRSHAQVYCHMLPLSTYPMAFKHVLWLNTKIHHVRVVREKQKLL